MRRIRFYETITPVRRAPERYVAFSAVLREWMEFERELLRSQIEEIFAPERRRIATPRRVVVPEALEAVRS